MFTSEGVDMGQLGYSVDIQESTLDTRVLAGKPEARSSGAVEMYRRTNGPGFRRVADWQIPTLGAQARFGAAVVLSTTTSIVVAPQVDSPILGPGTAFDYELPRVFGEARPVFISGVAGGLGVAPQVTTAGQLEGWHRLTIRLSQANPNSPGLLAVGSPLPQLISIFGGQIGVSFDITVPFLVDPLGRSEIDIPALPRSLTDLTVDLQAFVLDAGAPQGSRSPTRCSSRVRSGTEPSEGRRAQRPDDFDVSRFSASALSASARFFESPSRASAARWA